MKPMDDHNLSKSLTMKMLFDDLDIIEYYQQPGRAASVGDYYKADNTLRCNGSRGSDLDTILWDFKLQTKSLIRR